MLDPGDRRIADHLQHDRHDRHPPQAETAVQRTDQLGRDCHTGEQEGDRRLQFTPAPAKSLFEGNHQGSETVEQTRADAGADTDEAKQQDAPAAFELGEVDGRPLERNGCIGHMRTPISARRADGPYDPGLMPLEDFFDLGHGHHGGATVDQQRSTGDVRSLAGSQE
ncbi:hypothetical protein D3C78_956360 [compost metagenome]